TAGYHVKYNQDDAEIFAKPGPRVSTPTVTIAFEFKEAEKTFNFYIRRVSNAPFTPSITTKHSRMVMYVVKGLNRKTWIGRKREIGWEEVLAHDPMIYRTLAVPRCITTIFNEFFSCQLTKHVFHNTLMKLQFCDVAKDEYEVGITECDYWVDTNPIGRFQEFELPMRILTPDLGELDVSITYLPTSQRLVVSTCTATNLQIDPNTEEIHVRAILFVSGRFEEIHKSENRRRRDETHTGLSFAKKMVFDVLRVDIFRAMVVCQVVQSIDGR
uniref:Hemocyte protein-glutamine gamma-glutamyltransferase n=1 Tax=Angiostrongylus cantonensis TaxID=6313 RepID=A0A0K0DKE3_ANGCA